jgi:hypothetical protein
MTKGDVNMPNIGTGQNRVARWLASVGFLVGLLASPPALAQCVPAAFPAGWLQAQENAGGHTIARHVNVGDPAMLLRYNGNIGLPGSSRYTNLATAQQHIVAGLAGLAAVYNAWHAAAPNNSNLAFTINRGANVGVGVYAVVRPAANANIQNKQRIVTVMSKNANGNCFLLTSYPVP